jgi:hypothetical protein
MTTPSSGGTAAPAAHGAGAPGILAIWNDREDSIAETYERWYLTEHVPERLGVPGFLTARRYEAAAGSPRFFTCYEVESVDVLSSPDYLARLASPSPLTREVMAGFRNMVRTACVRSLKSPAWALGGWAVTAYAEATGDIDGDVLFEQAGRLGHDGRVLGVQVWRAAPDPAQAGTREATLRPGGDRRIEAALVVDVMREADGQALEGPVRAALQRATRARDAVVHAKAYRLLGQWQANGPRPLPAATRR